MSQFRIVGVEDEPSPPPVTQQENAAAVKMIEIALSAIWKQAVIATSHLFPLFGGASVFALCLSAPADPTTRQLVLLGGYALFVITTSGLVIWSRK